MTSDAPDVLCSECGKPFPYDPDEALSRAGGIVGPCCRETVLLREASASRLRRASLPARFRSFRFARYTKAEAGESALDLRARLDPGRIAIHADNVGAARVLRGWTGDEALLLVGPTGTGKTTILAARVAEIVEAGTDAIWIEEAVAFESLRDWDRRWDVIRKLSEVPLLVIDDLGSISAGGVWREDYAAVLARRYSAGLPLAATSNRSLDDLLEVFDERTVSRLAEDFGERVIEVAGYDWRTGRRTEPTATKETDR